ncbi:MAG: hypothetical protein H6831_14355 [Planctomycetes bacterium]|nr:hypothetical protein [Planctomycetota bacterium]MCB9905584.1 hypothetical protein [Planctomycetota bacterium]
MPNSHLTPHRGVLILVLGITSLMFTITGPFAWILGRQDLAAMDAGTMDPEGRSITQVGTIIGMIVTILALIGILFFLGILVLGAGAAIVSNG